MINAYRAARPTGEEFTFGGQALVKKFEGVGACYAPDLLTHAYPAALVSARNGISFHLVMKYRP